MKTCDHAPCDCHQEVCCMARTLFCLIMEHCNFANYVVGTERTGTAKMKRTSIIGVKIV